MKQFITLLLSFCFSSGLFSQIPKKLQKSWIKVKIDNLSSREMPEDSVYFRYTFTKSTLYISLNPASDDFQQTWSSENRSVRIGFDTYDIEELTDTSLTIKMEGYRRIRFLAEDYLNSQEKYLDSIGMYNGKPLYKANDIITPRYTNRKAMLRNVIQANTDGYNIKKAITFLVSFVVSENGRIENITVVNSISYGFDREVVKNL